jgi:glutamyl-tRNA synthetase
VEMTDASLYFYQEFHQYDEKAVKKNFVAGSDQVLSKLHDAFYKLPSWDREELHSIVINLAEKLELGLGKVAQPLRVALFGSAVSPAIDISLVLLGKGKVLARIEKAINHIKSLN